MVVWEAITDKCNSLPGGGGIKAGMANSRDLLDRTHILLSQLVAAVEESRKLLEESHRLIAKLKAKRLFED